MFAKSLIFVACSLTIVTWAGTAKAATPEKACSKLTASGLGYDLISDGKGAMPKPSDMVTVAYRGTLAADGTLFDESESADFPVEGVIPGFAEGLQLVKPGGKIRLCIPARLGYGARAAGPIPANSDLVFVVSLKGVAPPRPEVPRVTRVHGTEERKCTLKTPSGLGYSVIKAGAGASPTNADAVLVNYAGFLAADGKEFDAGTRSPLPVEGVIPGFSEGLKLMQRGGSYKLCIPAALAYGTVSIGPIPGNSDLVFDVDMIDFKSIAELRAAQQPQKPSE